MNKLLFILLVGLILHVKHSSATSYDHTAYTECKSSPEDPLYKGGIIRKHHIGVHNKRHQLTIPINSTGFRLNNLTGDTIYAFSCWIKIRGASSSLINATLATDNATSQCMGTVIAKKGCWSFLKGGLVLESGSSRGLIYFQNSDGKQYNVTISGASLQPFTKQQWKRSQQNSINKVRKRAAILHVSDARGKKLRGAQVVVKQVSRDFPFGSAIADTILGNLKYQRWFVKRFNAAVFENELKWYATEGKQGHVNYTIPDRLLEFTRGNNIVVRGHNIFWEDQQFTPSWVHNLTNLELKSAVGSRIRSLMRKYKNEFIHWDVNNEMLVKDFYEQRLGHNASLGFFLKVQKLDPSARLFMNEYNVLETCEDKNATVDMYVSRLQELRKGGLVMDGIGLEAHFSVPNPPLIRAVLDKLATLNVPIWLTEVDIKSTFDQQTQAKYLEAVLREGFSHPAVNGIILWSALHPHGCYRMCLTDQRFRNLPTGDVVDSLLKKWKTRTVHGNTDNHGTFSFSGFFGEYNVTVSYRNRTVSSTFYLSRGDETKHWNVKL